MRPNIAASHKTAVNGKTIWTQLQELDPLDRYGQKIIRENYISDRDSATIPRDQGHWLVVLIDNKPEAVAVETYEDYLKYRATE